MNCSAFLSGGARDALPGRAPLTLYSALAQRVVGLRVVVLGDASTDGIACLAQVASQATAVSATTDECAHLRKRASQLASSAGTASGRARTFDVLCADFLRSLGTSAANVPEADVYIWAQAGWRIAMWRQWIHRGTSLARCREHLGNCATDTEAKKYNHIDSFDLLATLRQAHATRHPPLARPMTTGRRMGDGDTHDPPTRFFAILDEEHDHDAWTVRKLDDHKWISERFRCLHETLLGYACSSRS